MTAELLGVKIDTSEMTLEELIESRDELQKVLDTLTHEIRSRKICEHKHKV